MKLFAKYFFLDNFPFSILLHLPSPAKILLLDETRNAHCKISRAFPKSVVYEADNVSVLKRYLTIDFTEEVRKSIKLHSVNKKNIPLECSSFELLIFISEQHVVLSRSVFEKILSPEGAVIQLFSRRSGLPKEYNHFQKKSIYYIYPTKGNFYCLSRDLTFRNWPFGFFQQGTLLKVRLTIFKILNQVKLGILFRKGICCVYTKSITSVDQDDRIIPCEYPEIESSRAIYIRTNRSALLLNSIDQTKIIKIPFSQSSYESLTRNSKNIKSIKLQLPYALSSLIPDSILLEKYSNISFWQENIVAGNVASAYQWNYGKSKIIAEAAAAYLCQMHKHTGVQTVLTEKIVRKILDKDFNQISLSLDLRRIEMLEEIYMLLKRVLIGKSIPLVLSHGDFWNGNVLVLNNNQIKGVIDWDESSNLDFPLLDLLHYIVNINKFIGINYFSQALLFLFLNTEKSSFPHSLINNYLNYMGIDKELHKSLIIVYWIRRISLWMTIDVSHENMSANEMKWFKRNFVDKLPKLREILRTCSI